MSIMVEYDLPEWCEGCKRFFQKIINEYDELPPELKDVSTFWIE